MAALMYADVHMKIVSPIDAHESRAPCQISCRVRIRGRNPHDFGNSSALVISNGRGLIFH